MASSLPTDEEPTPFASDREEPASPSSRDRITDLSSASTPTTQNRQNKKENAELPKVPQVESDTTTTPTDVPSINGTQLLNRFTTWRKQASASSLFRRTSSGAGDTPNSSVTPPKTSSATTTLWGEDSLKRSSWSFPLQSATLSPPSQNQASCREDSSIPLFKDEEAPVDAVVAFPTPPMGAADSVEGEKQRESSADANNRHNNVDDEDEDEDGSVSRQSSSSYTDEGGSSLVSSSAYTDESRVSALQWAATSVVDSVHMSGSYFRGRYSLTTPRTMAVGRPESNTFTPRAATQMTRILNSPQAQHLQKLQNILKPSQYIMLLGRGMLGVNLKQAFLKSAGVYVDFMVVGGAAERSGVMSVGDAVVAVGDVSVENGNLWTVPQTVAAAKRPVHLVLSTPAPGGERLAHVDACVALMHVAAVTNSTTASTSPPRTIQRQRHSVAQNEVGSLDGQTGQGDDDTADDMGEEIENRSTEEETPDDEGGDMELVTPTSFDQDEADHEECAHVQIAIQDTVESFVNPGIPPLAVSQKLAGQAEKRNNDNKYSLDELAEAASVHTNFRASLRNAFLTCVIDGRRFPFLARHFAQLDGKLATSPNRKGKQQFNEAASPAVSNSNAMLMLFLEMTNFTDLYGVTPPHRRHEIASRIAQKYFLPTQVGKTELVPPMFDFHQVVGDSALRQLEAVLREKSVKLDIFWEFQQAVADCLSARPFLTFLVSNEFARMRAYLRNTAPFFNVPLDQIFESLVTLTPSSPAAKNYFLYVLTYLLCLTDKEGYGENDEFIMENGITRRIKGNRVEDAASGLCASLFIRARVLPAVDQAKQEAETTVLSTESATKLIRLFEQLWENFVAPGVGALSRRSQCGEVDEHLKTLVKALHVVQESQSDSEVVLASLLLDTDLIASLKALAEELLYEYASSLHSKFRAHKFHEWMCGEFSRDVDPPDNPSSSNRIPQLPEGCIKRLLRKSEWPDGVAPHKPSHDVMSFSSTSVSTDTAEEEFISSVNDRQESLSRSTADCAVVFGTPLGPDLDVSQAGRPGMEGPLIRRYCCQTATLDGSNLSPFEIPATLESYAMVPESRPKPFEAYSGLQSDDLAGWEVSLVNFVVPRADVSSQGGEETSLYGVSLVFRQRSKAAPEKVSYREAFRDSLSKKEDSAALRKVKTSIGSPVYSKRLAECPWTERVTDEIQDDSIPVFVGLSLVSQKNVIISMREALTLLVRELINKPGFPTLVDLLGNFAHQDVEPEILPSILEPFLRIASEPWFERPIRSQKHAFDRDAGRQLIQSLPPIPLALLFVTTLLEQKIVLTSSRRSVLLSASTALSELLKPLKWCHLLVPRVPADLAADLLQYPAPYILGMPTDDPGIVELVRDLAEDCTLVDLDVGRVILAPSFAHDSELGRGIPNNADTARALRSQVLYLAECLGSVFGSKLNPGLWMCDTAHVTLSNPQHDHPFDALRSVCRDFVQELLAGTTSCCYWIEEASCLGNTQEPTILFDEDRFFHVKNIRESHEFHPLCQKKKQNRRSLALSLDNFDLVLELFLRCQSMNDYIGTRKREDMAFSVW